MVFSSFYPQKDSVSKPLHLRCLDVRNTQYTTAFAHSQRHTHLDRGRYMRTHVLHLDGL